MTAACHLDPTTGRRLLPDGRECRGDDHLCPVTDLDVATCAHCLGHGQPPIEPGVRIVDRGTGGKIIWPIRAEEEPEPRDTRTFPKTPDDADSRTLVAQDLRAILDMVAMLDDRAGDLADDPDMPGGDALVNLAGVANLEAWEYLQASTERLATHPDRHQRRVYTSAEDEAPEAAWPPFQLLAYWSEQWRRDLDMDYIARPTITTEARFLADPGVLAWAHDHETGWDDFVTDVHDARAHLENITRDGLRETRSRIVCDRCTAGRRLIRKWGKGDKPDTWKCPSCKHLFTDDEAKRAHAKQMRAQGAERWVTTTEALAALAVQGWQRRTVRRWIAPLRHAEDRCATCGETWTAGKYRECPALRRGLYCGGTLEPVWLGRRDDVPESWCDLATRRTFVWWPALWRRHMVARHDRESRAE